MEDLEILINTCRKYCSNYYVEADDVLIKYDNFDSIDWIRENKSKFYLGFSLIAEKYLIIEPTEVLNENLFSYGSITDCDLRKNLSDISISNLLNLVGNRDLLNKYIDSLSYSMRLKLIFQKEICELKSYL